MPRIHWKQLPLGVRQHLRDRVRDRNITPTDLERLMEWVLSNPEVPVGEWCKDFGEFTLAGEGAIPKTFLMRGQPCKGAQIR